MNKQQRLKPVIRDWDYNLHLSFPQKIELANGLTLMVVNGGDSEICRLSIAFPGGLFEEEMPLQASMTSSMVIHGSEKLSSSAVAERLDYNGSWIASRCYDHHTCLTLQSLNRRLEETLPLLMEIATSPAFPDREIELMQNRITASYHTARQRVKYLATTAMSIIYYPQGYPLAQDITDEQVKAVKAADMRRFHQRYWHANEATAILSGCIGEHELRLVKESLESLPTSSILPHQSQQTAPRNSAPAQYASSSWRRFPDNIGGNPATFDKHSVVVDLPNAVQAAIAMSLPAPSRQSDDYIPVRVLTTALGGYFGSRLMTNIREKMGYTYSISAALLGRIDDASIVIDTQCDCRYTREVSQQIISEMQRLCQHPLDENELHRVKQQMIADLVKTLDSPFSISNYIGSTIFVGVHPDYWNKQISEIRTITAEHIMEMARKWFNTSKLLTAVAGDRKVMGI